MLNGKEVYMMVDWTINFGKPMLIDEDEQLIFSFMCEYI